VWLEIYKNENSHDSEPMRHIVGKAPPAFGRDATMVELGIAQKILLTGGVAMPVVGHGGRLAGALGPSRIVTSV
jgi:hypothetical protein